MNHSSVHGKKSICVYCGASPGKRPEFIEAAYALGKHLAHHQCRLVYGGGTRGLMGAVADGVLEHGGEVLGIIPQFLVDREALSEELKRLSEVRITDNMHQRKWMMFEESDAFVTLPGGIGTLEELVEIMTWAQLDRHRKPVLIANLDGYWNPLSQQMENMSGAGYIHNAQSLNPKFVDQIDAILPTVLDCWAQA